MYLVLFIVALILLCFAIDVFRNRHPLTSDEARRLAQKRRRILALNNYRFCTNQRPADPVDKKAMNSAGEFVGCDLDYFQAPSRIAGLLKYKKHEWIVFAFISSNRVSRLWWNKGPDGTRVWVSLRAHEIDRFIRSLKPEAIAILHNHPNPNPARYRMNVPSRADLNSASDYHQYLCGRGVSLLEFICERGVPHLFYAAFADSLLQVPPFLAEVSRINGKGVFRNYALRKELRRNTLAEQIPGATHPLLATKVTRDSNR